MSTQNFSDFENQVLNFNRNTPLLVLKFTKVIIAVVQKYKKHSYRSNIAFEQVLGAYSQENHIFRL